MTEMLLSEFLATIGARCFAYLPFLDHLRIPKRKLPLMILLVEAVNLLAFTLLIQVGASTTQAELVSIPIACIFFFSIVRMEFGKVAFIFIFAAAYMLTMRGLAIWLLPSAVGTHPLTLEAGLLTLALFLVTMPLMLHFIRRTLRAILAVDAPSVWRTIWILPLFNFVLVMIFTFDHDGRADFIHLMSRCILFVVMFLVYDHIVQSVSNLQNRIRAEEELRHLEQLSAIQTSQYAILQARIEDTRRARHDLRQHLKAIQGCIASGDMEVLADYVREYGENLPSDAVLSYCKNYAVDAVLSFYANMALTAGIDMDISFQMEQDCPIPKPEFCVLLGNLLENALENCGDTGDRFIRVNAREIGRSMFSITVDNTSPAPPHHEDGRIRSAKHDGFGMGTQSVQIIAERYHGDARFRWENGVFFASVMLNP